MEGETTRDRDGNLIALAGYHSDESIDRHPVSPLTGNTAEIVKGSDSLPISGLTGSSGNIDRSGRGSTSSLNRRRNSPRVAAARTNMPARNSPRLGGSSPRNSPRSARGEQGGPYGSPGGDLGYESYDSRSQLVMGQSRGQSVI